jgi:hypothetical protein
VRGLSIAHQEFYPAANCDTFKKGALNGAEIFAAVTYKLPTTVKLKLNRPDLTV